MPQTKFVLRKALELDLPVIVCINKIDRPEARPEEVVDEVLELLMDLDASDEQLDCPFRVCICTCWLCEARTWTIRMLDMHAAVRRPFWITSRLPREIRMQSTQVLISTIDYNEYVGRIGVGKIDNGYIRK